jgi:hypothetical protein
MIKIERIEKPNRMRKTTKQKFLTSRVRTIDGIVLNDV